MNDEVEVEDTSEEQPMSKGLRKKQRREEKQARLEKERMAAKRKKQTSRALMWGAPILVIIVIGAIVSRSPKEDNTENPIIEKNGIHWHPSISVSIKGEAVTIPAGIGIGGVHADTHTHTENDQIHLEMNRAVRGTDTRLAKFFETWGKEFSSECILDACNGDEGTVQMSVNSEANTEFENYQMKDGDNIEIRFE